MISAADLVHLPSSLRQEEKLDSALHSKGWLPSVSLAVQSQEVLETEDGKKCNMFEVFEVDLHCMTKVTNATCLKQIHIIA